MDKFARENKLGPDRGAGQTLMIFANKRQAASRKVVAFTTHKAGSMVLHRVLKDICELNRVRYYSPNLRKSPLPFERIFAGYDFISKKAAASDRFASSFRAQALAQMSIILHLRDPRDVLVSMFYSYCYMHAGEIERHTGYRKAVAEGGIDRFVLDMVSRRFYDYRGDYGIGSRYKKHVGTVLDRYQRYLDEVIDRPNTILVSYEEMVLAFPSWLKKILSAFDLPNEEETAAIVTARHANSVAAEKEDVWAHKRKVTPGDHREKLDAKTIRQLDEAFGPILQRLGYFSPAYESSGIPLAGP